MPCQVWSNVDKDSTWSYVTMSRYSKRGGLKFCKCQTKAYPRCGSNSKVSIRAIILTGPLGATSLVLLCRASQPLMEALVVTRKIIPQ